MHLRSISLSGRIGTGHPFDLPLIQGLDCIEFQTPVTFLVGENGAGKSTLLESVAVAAKLHAVGGSDLEMDPSLETSRNLARCLRLSWNRKAHRGFFMRAEDFFGFTQRMMTSRLEMEELESEFDEKFEGHARQLATGVARGQQQALERYKELETSSHGEGFLHLFQERLVPDGLYLLDEPEAALSPQRQLALLALIKELVEEGSQFIIASHSPIIMAFPGATIYSLDDSVVNRVEWADLEHVRLTKDFLACPERYLRFL